MLFAKCGESSLQSLLIGEFSFFITERHRKSLERLPQIRIADTIDLVCVEFDKWLAHDKVADLGGFCFVFDEAIGCIFMERALLTVIGFDRDYELINLIAHGIAETRKRLIHIACGITTLKLRLRRAASNELQ